MGDAHFYVKIESVFWLGLRSLVFLQRTMFKVGQKPHYTDSKYFFRIRPSTFTYFNIYFWSLVDILNWSNGLLNIFRRRYFNVYNGLLGIFKRRYFEVAPWLIRNTWKNIFESGLMDRYFKITQSSNRHVQNKILLNTWFPIKWVQQKIFQDFLMAYQVCLKEDILKLLDGMSGTLEIRYLKIRLWPINNVWKI